MQGNILGQNNSNSNSNLGINGIIEEYTVASGGNVNAGDFVKFINNFTINEDTKLITGGYSEIKILAIQLTDNKVFIVYSYSSKEYLYGIVVVINEDNTITVGTDTKINNREIKSIVKAIQLTDNKVFIVYGYDYYLCGIVVVINEDNTITVGTDTQINDTDTKSTSVIQLTDNKVFIAYGYIVYGRSKYYYLCGIVVVINEDNTITVGTDTSLNTTKYSGSSISAVKITDNKVFIAHRDNSLGYLYGMVVTINEDNSITVGTDTQINDRDTRVKAIQLTDNKVFIVYGYGGYDYYLYGIVVVINEDNTITVGTDTSLSTEEFQGYPGSNISVVKITDNKVFITYGFCYSSTTHTSTNKFYEGGIIITINKDNSVTVEKDTLLSGIRSHKGDSSLIKNISLSAVKITDNKVFIAHSYSFYIDSDSDSNVLSHDAGGMIVTINEDNSITLETDTQFDITYPISAILLLKNKVFIAHNNKDGRYYLYGMLLDNLLTIDKASNKSANILGVSNTSGTEGQTVQVYVPSI